MRQRGGPGRRLGAALATCAAALALAACRSTPAAEIEVGVRHVGFDHQAGAPVVILQERDGERLLPIWIGAAEAQAIARELQQVKPPRPLTHDLVKLILDTAGVALRRVRITDLQRQTFFATLVLENAGRELEVDSRPSDAIALALRFACPILVSPALLDRASTGEEGGPLRETGARIWGLTVQDLTPALAELLGLPGVSGVLVSDAGEPGEGTLRRGDVIVAVDDTPVATVAALRAVAAAGAAVQQIEVRRGGDTLRLAFEGPRG